MLPVILWAIETGMRRGEILRMKWSHVDEKSRTLLIPTTKNGHSRRIPLTDEALKILSGLDKSTETVFPISANSVRLTWRRMAAKLGLKGLRFHDLRHEAISTLFERGLNIPEVSMISGHRDWASLKIYTQPRPADVLRKLNER